MAQSNIFFFQNDWIYFFCDYLQFYEFDKLNLPQICVPNIIAKCTLKITVFLKNTIVPQNINVYHKINFMPKIRSKKTYFLSHTNIFCGALLYFVAQLYMVQMFFRGTVVFFLVSFSLLWNDTFFHTNDFSKVSLSDYCNSAKRSQLKKNLSREYRTLKNRISAKLTLARNLYISYVNESSKFKAYNGFLGTSDTLRGSKIAYKNFFELKKTFKARQEIRENDYH